jgi:hypothetical protein
MTKDRPADQSAELFAAGRDESPSEATRLKILESITRAERSSTPEKASRPRLHIPLLLAAAGIAGSSLLFWIDAPAVHIAAEAIDRAPPHEVPPKVSPETRNADPSPARTTPGNGAPVAPSRSQRAPERQAPPSLDRELAAMQRARAALDRGDALGALTELSQFARGPGFQELSVEASLLRVEALARAGRTEESRSEAQKFVNKYPNNPLVNRAARFAEPSPSPAPRNP